MSAMYLTLLPAGGLIGARTGKRAKQIYADMKQPPGKPPSWAFAPVWTTIYGLTGFASYLARASPIARSLYSTSLLLNFLWTPLFFGLGRPGIAWFDIVALWVNIAALVPHWSRMDKRAGAIGGIYLTWVTFATYLNTGVWRLNYAGNKRT